jgi:DNA-binding transcriptional MerR regulator
MRRQLSQWSAFDLPKAALGDMPASSLAALKAAIKAGDAKTESPLKVPGLSYEQIRTLERHGLFDDYLLKHRRKDGEAFVLWKPRRRGDTRLYTVRDLFVCRLAAWMLHAGVSMQELATVLRREGEAAVTFQAPGAETVFVCRHATGRPWSAGASASLSEAAAFHRRAVEDWAASGLPADALLWWSFPLAYLGYRQTLPKLQKEIERAPVVRWNHEWQPTELHAEQQRAGL